MGEITLDETPVHLVTVHKCAHTPGVIQHSQSTYQHILLYSGVYYHIIGQWG